MSNPLWWLGGFYLLDKLSRQKRVAHENAWRIAELEKAMHGDQSDEQVVPAVGEGSEQGSCLVVLGCLASLIFLAGLVAFLLWLFFY